jgi:hypothetical protein
VAELVDEAHGKQRACVERASRVGVRSARLVQRIRQLAARRYVGEDDVAGVAEEQVVDLGCFSDCAGDVKFHFEGASAQLNQYRLQTRFDALDVRCTSIAVDGWHLAYFGSVARR